MYIQFQRTFRHINGIRLRSLIRVCALSLVAACAPSESPSNTASLLSWQNTSDNGLYQVHLEPRDGDIPIGEFHEWLITINDPDGHAVFPARVSMSGGMPSHGHGLPTQPQITEHLGEGRYRIEGVRFNMAGPWVLNYRIQSAAGTDQVQFDIVLTF